MSDIISLIFAYEDMCGYSETEMGEAAKLEYEKMKSLLQSCLPYVEGMIGIASNARFLAEEIKEIVEEEK